MRTDWPLGPALEQARIRCGISGRAAANRAGISSGRWYQLVSGVQKIKGQEIPISTTASTVAAAARAVDWDVEEALRLAGFDSRDVIIQPSPAHLVVLEEVPTDDLLGELKRRIEENRAEVERSGAPPRFSRMGEKAQRRAIR